MADMLARGAAWLASRQRDYASGTITYIRGAVTVVGLPAMVGRTEWAQDEAGATAAVIASETADWIVREEEWTAAGLGDPQRGDRVLDDSQAGKRLIYEVASPGLDQQPWRYTDRFRQQLRIHTKLVKEEARA